MPRRIEKEFEILKETENLVCALDEVRETRGRVYEDKNKSCNGCVDINLFGMLLTLKK